MSDKIWDFDLICPECREAYSRACREQHNHDGYCIDIDDIRSLVCGCYAHKWCQKAGPQHDCR